VLVTIPIASAVIVVKGGPRTKLLAQTALDNETPVIPIGKSGAAHTLRDSAQSLWWRLHQYEEILSKSRGDVEQQVRAIAELLPLTDEEVERVRMTLVELGLTPVAA